MHAGAEKNTRLVDVDATCNQENTITNAGYKGGDELRNLRRWS